MLDTVLGALSESGCDGRRPERRNIKRPESPIGNLHPRCDWVQEAVVTVPERRRERMQARDVHAAVEALLSEPVRLGSVKACLAANAAGSSPRFVRVAPGRYALGGLYTRSSRPLLAPFRMHARFLYQKHHGSQGP